MKVYISADIEGTAGITNWEEAEKPHATYQEFRERMTDEVVAACEGAIEVGAKEILVKDAHDSGRNIIAARLPDCARLIRGWSGHPFSMVQELDESFDALLFVGYHAKAGSDENPLAPHLAPPDRASRHQWRDRLGISDLFLRRGSGEGAGGCSSPAMPASAPTRSGSIPAS